MRESSSTNKSGAERRRLVQKTHYRLSCNAQPSHAQQAAKPYLDGIFEASEHIKKEITRNGESSSPSNSHRVRSRSHLHSCYPGKLSAQKRDHPFADVPLGTKASNVLAYSQEKLAPVLEQIQNFLLKKKNESVDAAEEVQDKAADKAEQVEDKATTSKQ